MPPPARRASGSSVTVNDVRAYKVRGERFTMMTAYDYTMATILASADIPILLVGDTLGMLMLGYATTVPVEMEEMLHHARAVARGAPQQLLVGDLPFGSYHTGDATAIGNAVAMLKAGMHAVKLEGGGRIGALVGALTERGIPVMGHLGLTPQSVNVFGGHRVQGRGDDAAQRIIADAGMLAEAGAFAIVLEGIPRAVAARVTASVPVPTIGIGAGPDCDGQVLVLHDVLGLTQGPVPKFVKQYADLAAATAAAARSFAREVADGTFPDDAHSYH